MKDAHSISTRRAYGVQRVCRVWRRARSSRLLKNTRIGLFSWPSCVSRPVWCD